MSGEKNNYKNVEQTNHPFFHVLFDKKDSGIVGKGEGRGRGVGRYSITWKVGRNV